jgi:hypothetical protein
MGDEEEPKGRPEESTKSAAASDRLGLIANHITESSSIRKRRNDLDSSLPSDYSDILGQIKTLRKIASTPDPNKRGYVRQRQAGKLWVRDRVEQLLDPGSFHEVGSVSGTVKWKKLEGINEEPIDYVPSNNVQGMHIRRRGIFVTKTL